MTGKIVAAAMLILLPAPAHAAENGEAEWRAWRSGWDTYYATGRFAVLKVNDAIFLKPGETAFLLGAPGEPASFRWTLEHSPDAVLHVAFSRRGGTGFTSRLVRGGESREPFALAFEPQHYPVNAVIDVQGSLTGEGTDDPRLQLKVFNQEHPATKEFTGLEFFDYAPGFRVEAVWAAAAEPEAVILDTERGLKKRFLRLGTARFSLAGKTVRLPLYALGPDGAGESDWFTLFTDETTGKETYGVGRYMDVTAAEGSSGRLLIDFNRAYNPVCARSKHYNCPLVEFHIPVPIRAGEKAPPGDKE